MERKKRTELKKVPSYRIWKGTAENKTTIAHVVVTVTTCFLLLAKAVVVAQLLGTPGCWLLVLNTHEV